MQALREKHSIYHDILLAGDINLDSNNWKSKTYAWKSLSEYFQRETEQLGMSHYSWGNTFHRINSGILKESALDHVFTTKEIKVGPKIDCGNSDHSMITFSLAKECTKKEHKVITYRKHMKDFAAFNRDLAFPNWENLAHTEDPDVMMSMFYELFYPVFDSHSPELTCAVNKNAKGLRLSKETKELIKKEINYI